MKTITISYDEEKLSALRLYLGQKDSKVEDEMLQALDALYQKSVPANVRSYLDMRAGLPKTEPAKPKKPKPAPVAAEPDPGGAVD